MKKQTSETDPRRTWYKGKLTQKDYKEFGKEKFVVFGIDPDGSRGSSYIGCSGMNLIEELINQRRPTIVIPEEKYQDFREEFGYIGFDDNSQQDPNFKANAEKYRVQLCFYGRR